MGRSVARLERERTAPAQILRLSQKCPNRLGRIEFPNCGYLVWGTCVSYMDIRATH